MEDVIGKKVMTLPLLNEWLEKIVPFMPRGTPYPHSREVGMPPGPPPRYGLEWKPLTHRWIRPEEEKVREKSRKPRLDEIEKYIESGGFSETGEKMALILQKLFPEMLNPNLITRVKTVDSIEEKEKRPKQRDMPKEKAVSEGIITEDEDWDGMKYNHFPDIIGGRVTFNNINEVMDSVQVLRDNSEKLGFKIIKEDNRIEKPLDGYYRRYHMLIKIKTDAGKTITMELQLGTANQTRIADWAHELLYKKGADRPILTSNDRRIAFKYIRTMAELYAYHDGVKGAKNVYPAKCVAVIKKFAGCLDVPES